MPNILSLGEYFPPLESRISGRIISPESFDRIKQLADTLPATVSAFWGFEVPLADESRTADFLFCSTQREGHSAVLAGSDNRWEIPEEFFELEAWAKVRAFCRSWEGESHELNGQLLNVWLEFDVSSATQPYQPSLFFGLLPPGQTTPEQRRRVITIALQELSPGLLTAAMQDRMSRVLARQDGSWAFQVGLMLARDSPAIRMCIRSLKDGAALKSFLEDIEWPGPIDPACELFESLQPLCESIDIDIDLGETTGPKLGFECSFGRSPATASYTERFCQWLVDEGLVSRDRADALIAYNGLVHQDANPSAWSAHLHKLAALSGPDVANHIACWVHHIKVVHEPGKPRAAKAYLAALTDRMPRDRLRQAIAARRKQ